MKNHLKNTGIKRCFIVLMCLVLSASVHADDEAYRIFTDEQGSVLEAKVIGYEADSETVVLKTAAGKTGRMSVARLSDEDRRYILKWWEIDCFQKGLELIPELCSVSVSKEEAGTYDLNKKVFDVFFKIRFNNRTTASFEKLEFEYCIFYNQGERGGNRAIQYEEGSLYGKGVVERLGPSSEQMSETERIRLFTEGGGVTLFGSDVVSIANVRGIWIRLEAKLPSGTEMMREYRTSDDELWKWVPCSFGAGMNEGARQQTFFYTK